jgi:hypothetical protein
MTRLVLLLLASGLMAGCMGPFIAVAKVPPERATAAEAVSVLAISDVARLDHESVQPVEGNSCRNLLWEPAPSEADAVRRLKYAALQSGANGITDLRCESGAFSLATNCWSSITCRAMAIRIRSAGRR